MDDQELDYLLAQGRLSGNQKERILAKALDAAHPSTRPEDNVATRPSALRYLTIAGAITAVLIAVPIVWQARQASVQNQLHVKGGAGQQPVIEASCAEACHIGSTLLFRVDAIPEPGYLAAYADNGDQRIWYFPTPGNTMPALSTGRAPVILKRGSRIGSEHRIGKYRLHLLLLRRPLAQAEISSLTGNPNSPELIAHVVQDLEVVQ